MAAAKAENPAPDLTRLIQVKGRRGQGRYRQGMVNRGTGLQRFRLPAVQSTTRPLFGLVVAISLLIAMLPSGPAAANPAVSDPGVICLIDVGAAAHHDGCGTLASHAGCIPHSGCLASAIPAAVDFAAPASAPDWGLANGDDPGGQDPLVTTPPPIAA